MAFNGVPWMVGGGSTGPLHNADLGRMVLYLATQGQQGVLSPADLAVTALTTPDHYVNVAPGAAVWICRAPGTFAQSYGDYMSSTTVVDVSPNVSASPRSDLLVAKINDNFADPSAPPPADLQTGPYVSLTVVPNVNPATTSMQQIDASSTAIDLARIDWPANTSAITNAYIVDLRSIIDPGGQRIVILQSGSAPAFIERDATDFKPVGTGSDTLAPSNTTFKTWPASAYWSGPLPDWAAAVDTGVNMLNAKLTTGKVWGETRMALATTSPAVTVYSQTLEFEFFYYGGGSAMSVSIPAGGRLSIPANMRGKMATLKMQARVYSDVSVTGTLNATRGGQLGVWANFKRFPG